jgi:hypothetical protein
VGRKALEANTTAVNNTAVGRECLLSNTTGQNLTAVGTGALDANTTANDNVAMGVDTLGAVTTGHGNTGLGRAAGLFLTTGTGNTCVGSEAGHDLTTGSNNLLLGVGAGRSNSPSGTITSGSDAICLGNNSIGDLFCADTTISSSDSRDKTDVNDFTIGLDWIKACRPVTYRWDKRTWYGTDEEPYGTPDGSKKRNRLHIGFLAQEMLAIEKANGYGNTKDDSIIVTNNLDEMSYGIKYERLVPILVNAIKELSVKVTALEAG